jgi:hypothetical protein
MFMVRTWAILADKICAPIAMHSPAMAEGATTPQPKTAATVATLLTN